MYKLPLTLIFLSSYLLSSCSVLNALQPVSAPVETSTITYTATETTTPTLTPTRTPTPTTTITPVPSNTATFIPEFPTYTPFMVVGVKGSPTPVPSATPGNPIGGFVYITVSADRLKYDLCLPNDADITVKVEEPELVKTVYIFFRLESFKNPGDTTIWYGTRAEDRGAGVFTYNLRTYNIPDRRSHLKSWIHYQVVAEDENKNILGRSHIYTRNIILTACE